MTATNANSAALATSSRTTTETVATRTNPNNPSSNTSSLHSTPSKRSGGGIPQLKYTGQDISVSARLAAVSSKLRPKSMPTLDNHSNNSHSHHPHQESNNNNANSTSKANNNNPMEPVALQRMQFFDEQRDEDYAKFVKSLILEDSDVDDNGISKTKWQDDEEDDDDDEEDFRLPTFDEEEEEEDDDDDDDDDDEDMADNDDDDDDDENDAASDSNEKDANKKTPGDKKPTTKLSTPESSAKKRRPTSLEFDLDLDLDLDDFDPEFYEGIEEELGGLEEEDLEAAVADLIGTTSSTYAHVQKLDPTMEGNAKASQSMTGENMTSVFDSEADATNKNKQRSGPSTSHPDDSMPSALDIQPTTPLRHVTGMKTEAAVTQRQVNRLQNLLKRHYQMLIQQAVLAIHAAHLAKTQRIKDKSDFLAGENCDDLVQVLDHAIEMLQNLDQVSTVGSIRGLLDWLRTWNDSV